MDKEVPSLPDHNQPKIEHETALQPRLIAAGVCQEVVDHLWRYRLELQDEQQIIEWLAARADQLYRQNIPFREKIRSENGRQHLCFCMRQWLANRLEKTSPSLHARLPEGFASGLALGAIW